MTVLRRKRLADGSFGELENVFDVETDADKIVRLESENAQLKADNETTLAALLDIYEIIGGDA